MKQFEFEEKLREMRKQQRKALEPLEEISYSFKQEIEYRNLQIKDIQKELDKLKINRLAVNDRLNRIKKEWADKIQAFMDENRDCMNNTWPDISTYTIVKQLRKRGWQGTIYNNNPDMAEEHKKGVIAAFNGAHHLYSDDDGAGE